MSARGKFGFGKNLTAQDKMARRSDRKDRYALGRLIATPTVLAELKGVSVRTRTGLVPLHQYASGFAGDPLVYSRRHRRRVEKNLSTIQIPLASSLVFQGVSERSRK